MVVICFPLLGARQDYADFFSGPIETIGVFVRIYVIIPLQKVDRENQRLYPRAMTTGTPLHILNQHSTVGEGLLRPLEESKSILATLWYIITTG
jgi:hypothetical protein